MDTTQQGLPTLNYLLQHTLRRLCTESQWVYAVFWRILPRNYPPPQCVPPANWFSEIFSWIGSICVLSGLCCNQILPDTAFRDPCITHKLTTNVANTQVFENLLSSMPSLISNVIRQCCPSNSWCKSHARFWFTIYTVQIPVQNMISGLQ